MTYIKEKQYLITDILYSSDGCKIYKCYESDKNNHVEYCLKKYFLSSDENRRIYFKALNELEIMLKLEKQHINILDLDWYDIDETSVTLTFKYTPNRDLNNYLANNRLSNKQIKNLLLDILKGMNFLHNNNIIHGDIKMENILIFNKNGQIQPKICDFNNSVIKDDSTLSLIVEKINREVGTFNYLAPEIYYSSDNLSFQSDMWSLGVLAFYLTYNEFPFDYSSENLKINMINKTYKKKFLKKNKLLNNLIENLLEYDINSRISSKDLLNHSYFKDNKSNSIEKTYKMNRKKIYISLINKSDYKLEIKVKNARQKCNPLISNYKCLITFTKLHNCTFKFLHESSPLNIHTNSLLNFIRSPIQYETHLSELISPSSYTREINNVPTKNQIKSEYNLDNSSLECVMIKLKLKIKIKLKLSVSIIKNNIIKNIAISYTKNDKLMLLHLGTNIYYREIEENINYMLGKKLYIHILYKDKGTGINKEIKMKIFNYNLDSHFFETIINRYSEESKEKMWKGELKYLIRINTLNLYY